MKHLFPLLLSALTAFVSPLQDKAYKNDKAGWTMTIPAGWERISENTVGVQSGMPGMNAANEGLLLLLVKGQGNYLMANLATYKSSEMEWEVHQKEENQRYYNAFVSTVQLLHKQCKIDSSTRHETVGNISFRVFETKAYTTGRKMVLDQLSYARLYSGNQFNVTIAVVSDMDKKAILDAWKRSVFKN